MARTLANYTGVAVPDLTDAQPTAAGRISGAVGGNDLAAALDDHDHSTGRGVPVPSAGLNINADLDFNANAATGLELVGFDADILDAALVPRSIGFVSGDVRWRKGDGSLVSPASSAELSALDTRVTALEALDISNRLDALETTRQRPVSLIDPRITAGTPTITTVGLTSSANYTALIGVQGVDAGTLITQLTALLAVSITPGDTIAVSLYNGNTLIGTVSRSTIGSGTESAAFNHLVTATDNLYIQVAQSGGAGSSTSATSVRLLVMPPS